MSLELDTQPEDLDVGSIVKGVVGVLVPIIVAVAFIFPIVNKSVQTAEYESTSVSGYPLVREANAIAQRKLTQYEVVDDAAGVYQIPIDRAIELIVNAERLQTGRVYSSEFPVR